MGDEYPEDVFVLNRLLLRCAGMWINPSWSTTKKTIYRIYAMTTFLLVDVFFTSTSFAYLMYSYKNVYTLCKNINYCLTLLMSSVKVVFWYTRRHILTQLMGILEDDKLHYKQCAGFQPGSILQGYKKRGMNLLVLFFSMAILSFMAWYTPAMVTVLVNPPEYGINGSSFYQTLPYYTWMPFDHSTPHRYTMALIYQLVGLISHATGIVAMDMLFVNMINFIAAHFLILQGAFESVERRVSDQLPDSHTKDTWVAVMNKEMKASCYHLQTVLSVRDGLENAYQYIALCQAMSTLFILCTSLYLISSTPVVSEEFLGEIVYLVSMGTQFFMYCWFGNEVTLKADEITMAIWKSDWLECDNKFKNAIMFAMIRMNNPVYMTLGKFAPLTLDTFVSVAKASYSAFAMIKNTES